MIVDRNVRTESRNAHVEARLITNPTDQRLILNVNGVSAEFPLTLIDSDDVGNTILALKEAIHAV